MKRKGKIDCTSDYRDQKRGARKEMAAKLRALVEKEKDGEGKRSDTRLLYCRMNGNGNGNGVGTG